jgi:glycerophosphoryl diester phosphodiesterase
MASGSSGPLIIAHRGFHSDVPENTIAAFERAATLGFGGIETDVQLDRTGRPILFHDYRVADGRLVKQLSREELSELVGFQVPLLADALDAVSGVVWDIEIKDAAASRPAEKVLRDFLSTRELFVSSFIHAAVGQLVGKLGIRGGLLVAHCPDGALLAPLELRPGVDTIIWDCDAVDFKAMQWATRAGLRNMVYGYRPGPDHAKFLRGAEIDGIITDFDIAPGGLDAAENWSQVF